MNMDDMKNVKVNMKSNTMQEKKLIPTGKKTDKTLNDSVFAAV
jgi:hypothetical protein